MVLVLTEGFGATCIGMLSAPPRTSYIHPGPMGVLEQGRGASPSCVVGAGEMGPGAVWSSAAERRNQPFLEAAWGAPSPGAWEVAPGAGTLTW